MGAYTGKRKRITGSVPITIAAPIDSQIWGWNGAIWEKLGSVNGALYHVLTDDSGTNFAQVLAINSDSITDTRKALSIENFPCELNPNGVFDRVRNSHFSKVFTNQAANGTSGVLSLFETPMSKHTWSFTVASGPAAFTLKLQGSLDNTNWFDLDEVQDLSDGTYGRHVTDKAVRYLRANLSGLSGSITLNLWILSSAR